VSGVRIARPSEALEELTGTVVVIDVLRASNTILSLLEAGAREVMLVAELERARALRSADRARLLVGERGGVTVPGFDGGNSPSRVAELGVAGRTVVLTTSAGTQGIARLTSASRVAFASFANGDAGARWATAGAPHPVTLLPMGLEAREVAVEDDLAADWIAARIRGEPLEFAPIRRKLLVCDGADRLRRLGQEGDLEWCTRLDTHRLVPVVVPGDPPRAIAWVEEWVGSEERGVRGEERGGR
jgi:2-phosphosulfolactate phosphatase